MASNCEMCTYYVYNEETDCYECLINLDEVEMYNFLSGSNTNCHYFNLDDEYGIVRKQN